MLQVQFNAVLKTIAACISMLFYPEYMQALFSYILYKLTIILLLISYILLFFACLYMRRSNSHIPLRIMFCIILFLG